MRLLCNQYLDLNFNQTKGADDFLVRQQVFMNPCDAMNI